jgi:hypothetical protein
MPKTIQIRDVDDDVYVALARRAEEQGLTVPDLLRKRVSQLAAGFAARPTVEEWLELTRRRRSSGITRAEIIETLDEWRGPWPDGERISDG